MVLLLLFPVALYAKTPKFFHCQQEDGRVVVQDRRCDITQLQQAQPKLKVSPKRQKKVKVKDQGSVKPLQTKAQNTYSNQDRSPYFVFGWDRFLPANWMLLKEEVGSIHHLLLSKSKFNGSNDFVSGIKLSVYSQTMRHQQQGAFSLALTLYHQIREQHSNQLIDSQFKSHERFKIFNIGYRINPSISALTEFYIDESNNDLFVLTIQSNQRNWSLNQILANEIISNL
ncbi:hypothetical protein C8D91_2324 [Marinicella litoralis]|uniref:Uncharacterized protein n=2 Tax=Marinicella litoralis TaxID=644220 RepID=A0A4R6XLF0_9GAMM|nr:hypothetical protein C8D91_2324 [Marinicella litoralis]